MKPVAVASVLALSGTALAQDRQVTGDCGNGAIQAYDGNILATCQIDGANTDAIGIENPQYFARSALGDWSDATGLLPDGSEYSQAQAFTSSISTTISVGLDVTAGFAKDAVNAAASASFGYSVTTTESTTNTETITITIDCPGSSGRIQYKPLYLKISGNLVRLHNCAASDCYTSELIGAGDYNIPQTGSSGFQLVDYQQVCEAAAKRFTRRGGAVLDPAGRNATTILKGFGARV